MQMVEKVDYLKDWVDKGILDDSCYDAEIEVFEDKRFVFIQDLEEEDSLTDVLIYRFHDCNESESFDYKALRDKISYCKKNAKNPFQTYISFCSWEFERVVIMDLKENARTLKNKNAIEKTFEEVHSVYFPEDNYIEIQVEGDGVNYLQSPNYSDKGELQGVVVNCPLLELKKLYNLTGAGLFKRNVREGVQGSKSGLKEIFSNYLSPDSNDDSKKRCNPNSLDDYAPDLFWFCHNGITIYVETAEGDDNFSFCDDKIRINIEKCSVINGAQTITNLFIAYMDLIYQYRNNDDLTKIIQKKLNELSVKLTITIALEKYSNTITRGLNTQSPITNEDFVAISPSVEKINKKLLSRMRILKTGEIGYPNGVKPLAFVKQYFIAMEQPGLSKNFNKNNLTNKIREISKFFSKSETETISKIIDRMLLIPTIERWWKVNIERIDKSKKSVIDKYGKNYFESFVLQFRDDEIDLDDKYLKVMYEEMCSILDKMEREISHNEFKKDDLYDRLADKKISGLKSKAQVITKDSTGSYEKELLEYIMKHKDKSPFEAINSFNLENQILNDDIRVIDMKEEKIKEHFHLSLKCFSELYLGLGEKGIDIQEVVEGRKSLSKDDFRQFEDSTLKKMLEKDYNIYLLIFNKVEDIVEIKFIPEFNFKIFGDSKKYDNQVEQLYNQTVDAFIEGEVNMFPTSTTNKIHIGTKATTKDDAFLFTNGDYLTKRTFWVSKSYVQKRVDEYLKEVVDKEAENKSMNLIEG